MARAAHNSLTGRIEAVTTSAAPATVRDVGLLRRGRALEVATLGWNAVGIVVLAIAALAARSVALAGFGLDSLIEIGASTVVLWELSGTGEDRQRRALRLIGGAFVALALYLTAQSTWSLITRFHPHHGPSASPGPQSRQPSCLRSRQVKLEPVGR